MTVTGKAIDVTETQKLTHWFTELGHVDVVVPNVSPISTEWDTEIAVDLQATVQLINLAIPYLEKSSHAAITYIGSAASSIPTPNMRSS